MAPASLAHFPTELLLLISESLCHHCTDATFAFRMTDRTGPRALLALSATCQRLRHIALPILYHAPTSFLPLEILAVILDQRPDIARCVKQLDLAKARDPWDAVDPAVERQRGLPWRNPATAPAPGHSWDVGSLEGGHMQFWAQMLISRAPRLENLTYHDTGSQLTLGGASIMDPARLLRALESCRATLQRLDLHFSQWTLTLNPKDYKTAQVGGEELAWFPSLHTVRLAESAFCTEWVPGEEDEDENEYRLHKEFRCLTHIIQPSFRNLSVILVDCMEAVLDVCHLGMMLADGLFPHLRRVEVLDTSSAHTWDPARHQGALDERKTWLEQSFAGTRIEFSYEQRIVRGSFF